MKIKMEKKRKREEKNVQRSSVTGGEGHNVSVGAVPAINVIGS